MSKEEIKNCCQKCILRPEDRTENNPCGWNNCLCHQPDVCRHEYARGEYEKINIWICRNCGKEDDIGNEYKSAKILELGENEEGKLFALVEIPTKEVEIFYKEI